MLRHRFVYVFCGMSFILPVKVYKEVNIMVYMQEMYVMYPYTQLGGPDLPPCTRIFSGPDLPPFTLISVILFSFLYIKYSFPLLQNHNPRAYIYFFLKVVSRTIIHLVPIVN